MPYTLTVEPGLRAVVARAYGAGDREEGLRLISESFELARETGARALIIDILELEFVPSNSDASVFSGQLAHVGRAGVRVAVVAPPGEPYGVARMVAILAEMTGASVAVCASRQEALGWARAQNASASRKERQ